jgi:hypothetical protein
MSSLKARIEALERKLKPLADEEHKFLKCLNNVLSFCDYIGFKPTEYQKKFLLDDNHFIVLRWARQSGKSATVSVKLLWYALKNPHWFIMVVGPSFRQSKLVLQKRITPLLKKVPKRFIKKVLKTRLEFMNGSAIECYPGNPDTIRGPTCHVVYVDEFNFIGDDEEIYDAILFTINTTNGYVILSSTPWTTDHMFYRICFEKEFDDYSRYHVTWREALEPNGPLKKMIFEKLKKQFASDPWRWKREMEAEFAEDEDVYLSQSLISSCIDPELEYWDERDLVANIP